MPDDFSGTSLTKCHFIIVIFEAIGNRQPLQIAENSEHFEHESGERMAAVGVGGGRIKGDCVYFIVTGFFGANVGKVRKEPAISRKIYYDVHVNVGEDMADGCIPWDKSREAARDAGVAEPCVPAGCTGNTLRPPAPHWRRGEQQSLRLSNHAGFGALLRGVDIDQGERPETAQERIRGTTADEHPAGCIY